jgi:YidC/Oxa1 family membrane protein insertase
MSLLDPVSSLLAGIIAGAHHMLTSLGADPDSGATWVLCIAAVVVAVRLALLPLVVHSVRLAHGSARARPQMMELTSRFRGLTDVENVRRFREERRAIAAEHELSRLGCLPLLLQVPVWMALYHLLVTVASGSTMGAMGQALVTSFDAATLLGSPLTESGYLGGGGTHLVVVGGLALLAAGLSYATLRFLVARNTSTDGVPQAMVSAQRMMPALSAVSLLVTGGVVPLALLVYWVCSQAWTFAQTAVIVRWFPTPGTPAAARLVA